MSNNNLTPPNKTKETLVNEFIDQSKTHPDTCLQEFYSALLTKLSDNQSPLTKIIFNTFETRQSITLSHYSNLVYRAIQYILLYNIKDSDFAKYKKTEWLNLLNTLEQNTELLNKFQDLLSNESTQTTIFQRYLGPKIIISLYFNNTPVKILDLGCGLNIGLTGIEQNEPFENVTDETPNQIVSTHINDKLRIENSTALDISDPVEKRDWALACGFYPQEIHKFEQVKKLTQSLWSKTKVEFKLGSILNTTKYFNKDEKFDVIIASTVLYQFSADEQDQAISEMKELLTENGIIIINDFMNVDPNTNKLVCGNWFGNKGYNYKTTIINGEDVFEFLAWDNARCKKVKKGNNYDEALKFLNTQNISMYNAVNPPRNNFLSVLFRNNN